MSKFIAIDLDTEQLLFGLVRRQKRLNALAFSFDHDGHQTYFSNEAADSAYWPFISLEATHENRKANGLSHTQQNPPLPFLTQRLGRQTISP